MNEETMMENNKNSYNLQYQSINGEWNTKCSTSTKECTICGAPSNGYHFNAPSCSACAAFFRRTVTLNRKFMCTQNNNCRVNFAMRVICRSCRYLKCVQMGMDRSAVQPRRDCNAGRRKLLYQEVRHDGELDDGIGGTHNTVIQVHHETGTIQTNQIYNQQPMYEDPNCNTMNQLMVPPNQPTDNTTFSPDIHYAQSYSSSISEEIPSPKLSFSSFVAPPFSSKDFEAEQLLDDLLREENLFNERRKLLYCSDSSITKLLTNENVNDIPFNESDIRPLSFAGIQKHIRPQILVIYEWLRGWRHFQMLNTHDRLIFLRRCVLYHTILDPSYLSYRLGLPNRFVMFNSMYVGIDESDPTGWEDEEGCITSELKIQLYRPLMTRVINEICAPMSAMSLSFVEFVILKSLVSFKSSACSDISPHLKKFVNSHLEVLLKALNLHYQSIGLPKEEIVQRTGNLVLMMSNIFAVGMECLESHQKIQFFDLWQMDELLMKLISRASST